MKREALQTEEPRRAQNYLVSLSRHLCVVLLLFMNIFCLESKKGEKVLQKHKRLYYKRFRFVHTVFLRLSFSLQTPSITSIIHSRL